MKNGPQFTDPTFNWAYIVQEVINGKTDNFCRYLREKKIKNIAFDSEGLSDSKILAIDGMKFTLPSLDTAAAKKILVAILTQSEVTNLSLSIDASDISETVNIIATHLSTSKLTRLSLRFNKIGPIEAQILATGLKDSNLVWLDLGYNEIGTIGAKALAASLVHSKIKELALTTNKIDSEGIASIANVLNQTDIEVLDLTGNEAGSIGTKAIMEGLIDSKIRELCLLYNKLDDEAITILAKGLNRKLKLNKLNLSANNQISDNGVATLGEGLINSNITCLEINKERMNPEIVTALEKTLAENRKRMILEATPASFSAYFKAKLAIDLLVEQRLYKISHPSLSTRSNHFSAKKNH